MTTIAKKVLIGLEDLALGSGAAVQQRGDSEVAVTKIDTDWNFTSLTQIKAADTSKIKHVVLINEANERSEYDYYAASSLTANDIDVLQPNVGSGRWVLRRVANTQTHSTAVGVNGAAYSSHSGIPTGFVLSVLYYDDSLVPGTGGSYTYTGTTIGANASLWPAPDGYYYDLDGKQFSTYDTAKLPIGVNLTTATSYTYVLTDGYTSGGKSAVLHSNSAAITATIPPNSSVPFAIGTIINVAQVDEGLLTIAPGAGVTLTGSYVSRGANHAMSLLKIATNSWIAFGGIAEEEAVPVVITLNNHTLTNTNALSAVSLFPNGELLTIDTAGGILQPNEWCVPRVTDIGFQYEARMTKVSGDNINQGAPVGVWFPISSVQGWGVQENGATLSFVGTLEIREIGTVTILDTATITMTSTYSA